MCVSFHTCVSHSLWQYFKLVCHLLIKFTYLLFQRGHTIYPTETIVERISNPTFIISCTHLFTTHDKSCDHAEKSNIITPTELYNNKNRKLKFIGDIWISGKWCLFSIACVAKSVLCRIIVTLLLHDYNLTLLVFKYDIVNIFVNIFL